MMKLRTTLNIIEPSEGMYFTQNNDVPIEDRIISDKIYLGINDSADNWKEISVEEATIINLRKSDYETELMQLAEYEAKLMSESEIFTYKRK